jgi:homoserine O-acetyltransferase/O-succinyltransferase
LAGMKRMFTLLLLALCFAGKAQVNYPTPISDYYTIKNFAFQDGGTLPALKQHYYTVGKAVKDKTGNITNAVLILHGTTAQAKGFLGEAFAGHLFGPGQPLDANKYFIILPDGIGHGQSSKPSDGLHMKFPKYTYDDMVKAQYELLTEHLHVSHLKLILGTSMGAMHAWVWGYTYPDFADALMPLASQPGPIIGRNRMMRKMAIDLIEMDPAWKDGEYTEQPKLGLSGALSSFFFMNSSPLQLQKSAPTREAADSQAVRYKRNGVASLDANDVIYALEASRFYDPSPYLSKIKATLFAINSADDEINPAELDVMERGIKQVPKGRYILLPISEHTAGHGTNSLPAVWGDYLTELLKATF